MKSENYNVAIQRINKVVDENSFVEIGALVTARNTDFNLNCEKTPSDGVVTGYGLIDGNLVYVYSQDSTVLNGSIGEMHAEKICKLYEMALKMKAPIIGFIDSIGVRLQESVDALEAIGKIMTMQSKCKGIIPQYLGVFGRCAGVMTTVASLSDFVFVDEKAEFFLNSPDAIESNFKEKMNTSCPIYQGENNGIIDMVEDEESIYSDIRNMITFLPLNNESDVYIGEGTDDLNRVCPSLPNLVKYAHNFIEEIADDNRFFEVKSLYAQGVVTGFIHLNGMAIGIIANNMANLDEDGNDAKQFKDKINTDVCEKMSDFIEFCSGFSVPILTITNINGIEADLKNENNFARHISKVVRTFTKAKVPKVNLITDKAFGSSYIYMNSKSLGADIVLAWDNAQVGTLNADLAVKIMYPTENLATLNEKEKEYKTLQNNVVSAARRGYIDKVISPEDTRKYLIAFFEMLYSKECFE
ncbi:carboxyl transferase domain-containing protein [Lachnobacterium bovis]|uniref:carboxyl transferase domain-containing protein n=1 Tax=Lachnobacterium bovis TaxID=140626 RepID=UPI000484842F|nr:carboxyl transferase domain-containing protein [Lachnobacterium bovis]